MMQTILSMFAIFISITRAAAPPPNDTPCDAQEITSPQVVDTTTTDAYSDSQPSCGASTNTFSRSVWFHIPGQIQDLTVSTCKDKNGNALAPPEFDTQLSIFEPNSCGCINCADPSSFICVDGNGNDEKCDADPTRSTVSISGTYCDLYVVLHGSESGRDVGSIFGTAQVSFEYTSIDQTESNPCPACGESFAPMKEECETCLSWNSYLNTDPQNCGIDLEIQNVDFQDLLSRNDNCLDGFMCVLDDGPGSIITLTQEGSIVVRRLNDAVIPEATIRKGICVAEDGISTTVATCMTDDDCPDCMRCCADENDNKVCKRSSGDICGLIFEERGPCCCPEYVCKGNECITQAPTPAPSELPTPAPSQLPTPAPIATPLPTDSTPLPTSLPTHDDNDDVEKFYAAEQMLNGAKNNENENENINSITAMLNKTLMALWSMITVILIGLFAMIIFGCVYLYKKKGKGKVSFKNDINQDIEEDV